MFGKQLMERASKQTETVAEGITQSLNQTTTVESKEEDKGFEIIKDVGLTFAGVDWDQFKS